MKYNDFNYAYGSIPTHLLSCDKSCAGVYLNDIPIPTKRGSFAWLSA